jgi:protein-ribulosamine 3-kinase
MVQAALREALGDPSLELRQLVSAGGGCINHAARAETSAGEFFVKWNADGPDDIFQREADGLRELAGAGSPLLVPRVFGAWGAQPGRPPMIVMEALRAGRTPDAEAALGRGLAALHRQKAARHGFPAVTYCGATPQDNTWTDSWLEFYRERRLRTIVDLVTEHRGLGGGPHRTYERLLEQLDKWIPRESMPSLIHGDLWGGNVFQTPDGPALVDPACAYADRELELGMMTLFGGFGDAFWRAYEEAWPLPAGWRERNPLYQLYHVLNHQYLFGGHYGAQALDIARRFL